MSKQRRVTRLRRAALPALALLAGLVMLLASQNPRDAAVRAQSEQPRGTQSIWLVTSAHLQDGGGATIDLGESLRGAVSAQLGDPVQLSPTLSYQRSEAVGGRATAADGSTLASVGVQLGLLTVRNSDGSTASVVAALATPLVSERTRALGAQDRVAIDLSSLPAVQPGETADISYAFLQLLAPAAASSEAGLPDEQRAGRRFQAGGGRLLSTTDAAGNESAAVTPPLPLTLQASELATATPTTTALYLRASQSGGVEGVFDALGALNLDAAQLLPVAATPQAGESPLLSVIRAVAAGSTPASISQATANNGTCPLDAAQSCGGGLPSAEPTDAPTASPPPTPPPSPSPTPVPADCDLKQGCDFYGEGTAEWLIEGGSEPLGKTEYEISFEIHVLPQTVPGSLTIARASGVFVQSGSDVCSYTALGHGDLTFKVDDINAQLPVGAVVKFEVVQSSAQTSFAVTCQDPAHTVLTQLSYFPPFTLDYLPLSNHGAASGQLADPAQRAAGESGSLRIELVYIGPYQPDPLLPPPATTSAMQRH